MSHSKPHQEIIEEETNGFPQFDVASSMSDHHFRNSVFSPNDPNVQRKIMNEWRILRENLPPTIFVCVNESRINLMTAVIVGAAGTPYHDGLYCFDIAFPNDYPWQPPSVYYRSYGLHINPNLYTNGYVCLSLINTWKGAVAENWNPLESTILQVLVSIQALVLNDKPYFNEPGRRNDSKGKKLSSSYNEDVFVLCCKTMLKTLSRPPRNFESLVVKHFNERGRVILEACVAYVKNTANVGYYGCDGSCRGNVSVSKEFKTAMMILVPRMVNAFTRNGGRELETFVVQMKTVSSERKSSRLVGKKNGGFVMRFLGMAKKVLGLKKGKKNGSGDNKNSTKT